MTLTRRSLIALTASAAAMAAAGAWADTAAPAPAAPDTIKDLSIGSATAKVVLAEYLSFTCPHCAHFHEVIYPKLKADYIDTGKVRLEYHEVYFDQLGLLGAMLARCSGDMRYFGITDMLYDKQRDWAAADNTDDAVAALKKFGLAAGMSGDSIDTCLHDQTMAQALVAHYQASIAKDFPNDSFQGTPSFLVNGVANTAIFSNMTYEDLQKILDAELAK